MFHDTFSLWMHISSRFNLGFRFFCDPKALRIPISADLASHLSDKGLNGKPLRRCKSLTWDMYPCKVSYEHDCDWKKIQTPPVLGCWYYWQIAIELCESDEGGCPWSIHFRCLSSNSHGDQLRVRSSRVDLWNAMCGLYEQCSHISINGIGIRIIVQFLLNIHAICNA